MVDTVFVKNTDWESTRSMVRAIISGESDIIANMANVAAILWQSMDDINWVGFYRVVGQELVLGPFQGKPACIRIPLGKGVCGTSVVDNKVMRVADVHAFEGHIACDAATNSEIVLPLVVNGEIIAVLDIDSPKTNRFSEVDEEQLIRLVNDISLELKGQNERID